MSKYDHFATVMKDQALLVAALQDLGHTVEVFKQMFTPMADLPLGGKGLYFKWVCGVRGVFSA
jgi:hypothetical protein